MAVTILIAVIISTVLVSIWYSNKKQTIYNEYQQQMEQYLDQLEEPHQQTIEEYTFFFRVKEDDRRWN